jgi:hypothetical protein
VITDEDLEALGDIKHELTDEAWALLGRECIDTRQNHIFAVGYRLWQIYKELSR